MLVPVSMTFQWAAEIKKFSGDLLHEKDIFIAKKVCRILQCVVCVPPASPVLPLIHTVK